MSDTATAAEPPVLPLPAPPAVMTLDEFRERFRALSNWHRWGADDELGTLNWLSATSSSPAGARPLGLGRPLSSVPGDSNFFPIVHGILPDADIILPDGGVYGHMLEFIGLRPHGQAVTHLDALCHYSFEGRLYNGFEVQHGLARRCTVMTLRAGVAARGVLLDVPAALGLDWIEPGHSVTDAIAEYTAVAQGLEIRSGDVVFVRTGRDRRVADRGPWETRERLAGVDALLLEWLKQRRVSILGCDGVSDTYPSPVVGIRTPIHILSLVAMGMPLIDNCYLEDLATACRERGSWEFGCMLAPIVYPGGSSAPLNPLALL